MVSEAEMKRVIKRTKKNEQWAGDAKKTFIANIESLMVFLAHRAIKAKDGRWGEGPQRITPTDVNCAFGEIWPNLYHMCKGEKND